MGLKDLNQKFMMKDLVKSDEAMFAATGVTDGTILKGVRFTSHGAVTHSIVMRAKTKTIRFIEAHHHFEHFPEYWIKNKILDKHYEKFIDELYKTKLKIPGNDLITAKLMQLTSLFQVSPNKFRGGEAVEIKIRNNTKNAFAVERNIVCQQARIEKII